MGKQMKQINDYKIYPRGVNAPFIIPFVVLFVYVGFVFLVLYLTGRI